MLSVLPPQLPLAKSVHDFYAHDRTARRPKGLEAEHRVREAFHRPMVLFYEVVEILGVADNNGRLVSPVLNASLVTNGSSAPLLGDGCGLAKGVHSSEVTLSPPMQTHLIIFTGVSRKSDLPRQARRGLPRWTHYIDT